MMKIYIFMVRESTSYDVWAIYYSWIRSKWLTMIATIYVSLNEIFNVGPFGVNGGFNALLAKK